MRHFRQDLQCFVCDKYYIHPAWFNKHLYKEHPKEMQDIENLPFDLPYCGNKLIELKSK